MLSSTLDVTLQYLLSFVFFPELGAVARGLQKHARTITAHKGFPVSAEKLLGCRHDKH